MSYFYETKDKLVQCYHYEDGSVFLNCKGISTINKILTILEMSNIGTQCVQTVSTYSVTINNVSDADVKLITILYENIND